MRRHGEAFVGIDTGKARNALAVAEGGREGEVRYLGESDNTPDAATKLVRRLAERYETVQFCYEAGPTGYGLYRQIVALRQSCIVVAPSLIPRKPGDRVKTTRRDAQTLARPLRAGELTAVWVPDETHEAVRDLVRTRAMAIEDYRRRRQHVSSFLLRHGRSYECTATWKGRTCIGWIGKASRTRPSDWPSRGRGGVCRPGIGSSATGSSPTARCRARRSPISARVGRRCASCCGRGRRTDNHGRAQRRGSTRRGRRRGGGHPASRARRVQWAARAAAELGARKADRSRPSVGRRPGRPACRRLAAGEDFARREGQLGGDGLLGFSSPTCRK